jgi:hypothetical protein
MFVKYYIFLAMVTPLAEKERSPDGIVRVCRKIAFGFQTPLLWIRLAHHLYQGDLEGCALPLDHQGSDQHRLAQYEAAVSSVPVFYSALNVSSHGTAFLPSPNDLTTGKVGSHATPTVPKNLWKSCVRMDDHPKTR